MSLLSLSRTLLQPTRRILAGSAASRWTRAIGGAAVIGTAMASIHSVQAQAAPAASTSTVSQSKQPAGATAAAASTGAAPTTLRVGLIQMSVGADKQANLAEAAARVAEAKRSGAQLIMLPEMFNCPYSNASFDPYSEELPSGNTKANAINATKSPSAAFLSNLAKEHGIWLVGGSMPERDASNPVKHAKSGLAHHLYNTCLVFDPSGNIVAKHRKMHLFDIDVPGGIRFMESDNLSPGNDSTMFQTEFGKIGVGICYDIRFPEYAQLLAEKGADILVYPAAFNTTTGPLHWELLQRARAVDQQLFVLTASPARSPDLKSYQAWGHTMAVSPWGKVIATTEHSPEVVIADLDLNEAAKMRQNIPVRKQKRNDIYQLKY